MKIEDIVTTGDYIFTISEIRNDGWVWGSEIRNNRILTPEGKIEKNFHNPKFLTLITTIVDIDNMQTLEF